jgi:hypothetical protein
MRYIVALGLAVIMLVVVPRLWQQAMIDEVNRISTEEPVFVASEPITTNFNSAEIGNITMGPPVEINTEEYEAIAVRSQADQAMRQAQAAQDQAWAATH